MPRIHWERFVFVAAAIALIPVAPLLAQALDPAPTTDAAAQKGPSDSGYAHALQRGPRAIALRDQATLKLPEGFGYLPTAEASKLMLSMGNDVDANFIGLIVPLGEKEDWMVSVDYDPAGYIKDDDAKNWKSDELLQNLKDGTEAGNERREKLGIPGLEVTRWIEPPAYDSTTQRLVWSVEAREKNAAAGAENTVNYNTYVLGRDGYISLDLITSATQIEAQKPIAKQLLAAVSFSDGKRYADFDSSTDKIAAYGLAALVGGLAAKKLGLLAVAGVFLIKFFKIILVAVLAGGATLRKFFTRKRA
jgi:uncharacterized membrane-anchored protein